MPTCLICDRVRMWREGKNPYFVNEFKNSILVVGDHQFFKGYCLVLLKEHVREVHELSDAVQGELFREVMAANAAVVKAFKPWKMNLCSLGNKDEHVHWHIMPRYETDPNHQYHPFKDGERFADYATSAEEAGAVAAMIAKHL